MSVRAVAGKKGMSPQDPGESERTVAFDAGKGIEANKGRYCTNKVVTSKYTPATFLPKNIWEQLQKFGNVYFLLISIVMYLGEKTPLFVGTIKAFSTLGLLLMMMAVSGLMAFRDDHKRKEADAEINATKATGVQDGREKPKVWSEVAVGDMLLIRQDQEIPADMVPLWCSGDGGNCYVSTANLDGETNLKLKTAPKASQTALGESPVERLSSLSGSVKAEAPNANIHDFSGALNVGQQQESLGGKQILLRGTVLRNTALCLGVVVYTGADTRMVRNSRPAPLKMSNLERVTNTAMFFILASQAVLAVLSDFLHMHFRGDFQNLWYLFPPQIFLPEWLGYFLTFFTLYSNLMPISLYPTAEFCNAFQAYFITNDKKMFFKEKGFNDDKGFHARARSSNLVHELGQVNYVLSDKTGTLTQNVMELKRISVAGTCYGTFEGDPPPAGFSATAEVLRARGGPQAQSMDAFLEALAVAHTVMASRGKGGELKYEAESPDEDALVSGVANLGWKFVNRKGNTVEVEVSRPSGQSQTLRYQVHATNEFNSTRKRQSVVVQKEGSQDYLLLVKGADNVMLERARASQDDNRATKAHLKEFSTQGLRTLLIGSRKLSAAEFQQWLSGYQRANRETANREEKLGAVAEQVETNLELLGITAIEDKLQKGVPKTIERIREAGIKLWVLTGDKLETARNIGFSTRVLTTEMNVQTVDKDEGVPLEQARSALKGGEPSLCGMMISGSAIQEIWENEERKMRFLDTAQGCAVLIACRVSPRQKAQLVALVREGIKPTPVTLAIGDGANDVPMIQEAQVGVGIAGREGRQAVNNSDFAIGQFKYLQQLLFVHGRWNYRRACAYTLFTFWRNMVQVLMIVYYTWISGYSGTSLFEDWVRLSFNPLCTLPILAVGCLDKDVDEKVARRNPTLYDIGRKGMDLNVGKVVRMLGSAVVHSSVLHWLTVLAFPHLDVMGSGDYYTFGTICYTCLVIDVNYRVSFMTNTHNRYSIGSLVLSLVLYIIFLACYTEITLVTNILEPNMVQVPRHMIKTAYFWLCILMVPLLAVTFDMVAHYIWNQMYPSPTEIAEDELNPQRAGCWLYELIDPESSDEESRLEREPSEFDSDSEDEDQEEVPGAETVNDSDFAQQRERSFRVPRRFFGCPAIVTIASVACAVFGLTGLCAYSLSNNVAQVRIQYAKETAEDTAGPLVSLLNYNWVIGTKDDERFSADCDGRASCMKTVTIPRDMTGTKDKPLLVYYGIGPYFQNYNDYLKSENSKELAGDDVTEAELEVKCRQPETREFGGEKFSPCGMKAMSMFNDTYAITKGGLPVNIDTTKNLAWPSDVARYENPTDYPEPGTPGRADTTFVSERFPNVIDSTLGVKTQAFANWMRPSAMPRVWNRYGYIKESLKKGDEITISVANNYPVADLKAFKVLVITEVTPLGARHNAFGIALMVASIFCLAAAVIVGVKDRFLDGGYDTSDSESE